LASWWFYLFTVQNIICGKLCYHNAHMLARLMYHLVYQAYRGCLCR
jgi:hypothetical protein